MKRLRLHVETVRVLSGSTLDQVHGGAEAGTAQVGKLPGSIVCPPQTNNCGTCFCPPNWNGGAQ